MVSQEQRLRELVAKWRAYIFTKESNGEFAESTKRHANELEALLNAEAPAPPTLSEEQVQDVMLDANGHSSRGLELVEWQRAANSLNALLAAKPATRFLTCLGCGLPEPSCKCHPNPANESATMGKPVETGADFDDWFQASEWYGKGTTLELIRCARAAWGAALVAKPVLQNKEPARCNYYFGGFNGGNRCQLPGGHVQGGHKWILSLEPAAPPAETESGSK